MNEAADRKQSESGTITQRMPHRTVLTANNYYSSFEEEKLRVICCYTEGTET